MTRTLCQPRGAHACIQLAMLVTATLCSAVGRAAEPDQTGVLTDTLVYPNRNACTRIWRAASSEAGADLLKLRPDGLTLTDISGDCWRQGNNQKAVFLRTPSFKGDYFFEVTIRDFVPGDRHAQVGLVAWHDADNYIRNTVGFQPAGCECVAEFDGKVRVRGIHYAFPRRHPMPVRLRIEVRRRTVLARTSLDGTTWQTVDATTLPGGVKACDFIRGIGLIGVGGRMKSEPVFADWQEGPLPDYRDDDFTTEHDGASWLPSSGAGGWGRDRTTIRTQDGHLLIRPFPGADIFFDNGSYPFVSQPAPVGDRWQLTVKIDAFDATVPGRWRKGGIVLWQGRQRWLALTVVTDDQFNHMYFELLARGATSAGEHYSAGGFGPRRVTDALLRISKIEPGRFHAEASHDGTRWFDLGTVSLPLEEPRLRLFASGDVTMQHGSSTNWAVTFDYVRVETAP